MGLLEQRSPRFVAGLARVYGPLARLWFRFQLRGIERLPPPPCLIVANHSGGGPVEVLCMLAAWHERVGEARPVHGLMHDVAFVLPGFRRLVEKMGAAPASHGNAREVIRGGRDVLVFPGGDIDALRPIHRPRDVVFGKRRGYAKLALELGVPVVPLATIGSHWTFPQLPGGALAAKLLFLRQLFRIERTPVPVHFVAPLLGAAGLATGTISPWLAAAAFASTIFPLPARVTSEFLAPISLEDLQGSPEERVEAAHARIHGALALGVRNLKHEATDPTPVGERLTSR